MFKNIKIYFMILLSIILVTACGGEKIESQRMRSPIEIDGNSDDWSEYRQVFKEDWKIVIKYKDHEEELFALPDLDLVKKLSIEGSVFVF